MSSAARLTPPHQGGNTAPMLRGQPQSALACRPHRCRRETIRRLWVVGRTRSAMPHIAHPELAGVSRNTSSLLPSPTLPYFSLTRPPLDPGHTHGTSSPVAVAPHRTASPHTPRQSRNTAPVTGCAVAHCRRMPQSQSLRCHAPNTGGHAPATLEQEREEVEGGVFGRALPSSFLLSGGFAAQ